MQPASCHFCFSFLQLTAAKSCTVLAASFVKVCILAAGRLREGMMIGYDNDRMTNLWPTKNMVPNYK